MKRFGSWLLASSPFDVADLTNMSMPAIREAVFRFQTLLIPLAVPIGGVYNYAQGNNTYILLVNACLMVFGLTICWLLFAKNIRIISPLLLLMLSFAALLGQVVIADTPDFLFIAIIFPVAAHLLVDTRQLIYLNLFWCAASIPLGFVVLPGLNAVIFAGTMAGTCLFLEVVFYILAYHEEQLQKLVVRDPLTNTYNRRTLEAEMEHSLNLLNRYGAHASIVMIDIDHFKEINDTHGHGEGDRVLKNLADLLMSRVRSTDRVCRYGGEEFILILPNTTGIQAYQMADSLREHIADLELSPLTKVTVSCGVAECHQQETLQEWLSRCDTALYRAKKKGRNRVERESLESVA